VSRVSRNKEGLMMSQADVLKLLEEKSPRTVKELAKILGIRENTVRRNLRALRLQELVDYRWVKDEKRKILYMEWFLKEERDKTKKKVRRMYLKRCIICKKTFEAKNPRKLTCTEECRRERERRKLKDHPLSVYKRVMKHRWKDKSEEFLLKRLHQSLIRIEVLKKLLEKKYNYKFKG